MKSNVKELQESWASSDEKGVFTSLLASSEPNKQRNLFKAKIGSAQEYL